jgi:DNA-binding NarL/FixJ family response regulator
MIRVLVADDHHIVRAGMREILSETGDIRVVAEAATGKEVLQRLEGTPVDVLVLDISMPDTSFLDVLGEVRARFPAVKVVVVSAHREEEYAVRSFRAGALGYVTKERSPDELTEAIRRAHRGTRFVTDSLAERLAVALSGEAEPEGAESLSDREFQVLRLIGAGRSVKQIAAQLKLSPKTVSTYRTRLLEKLHLRTTADLIRYAVEQNIVS